MIRPRAIGGYGVKPALATTAVCASVLLAPGQDWPWRCKGFVGDPGRKEEDAAPRNRPWFVARVCDDPEPATMPEELMTRIARLIAIFTVVMLAGAGLLVRTASAQNDDIRIVVVS